MPPALTGFEEGFRKAALAQPLKKGENIMSNKPTHKALSPIKQKGTDKPYWHRVGSAWATDKTISIKLNSFPVNGEINLFPITEKVEGEDTTEA